MVSRVHLLRGLSLAALAFGFCLTLQAAAASDRKEVLVIFPDTPGRRFSTPVFNGIESALAEAFGSDVAVSVEEVPLPDPLHPELIEMRREWLRKRYTGRHIDLIIAVHGVAIDAVHSLQAGVWPDAPVVFTYSAFDPPKSGIPDHATGRVMQFDSRDTLRVGLQLFPDTRHVFIIGGSSAMDRTFNANLPETLHSERSDVQLIDLRELTLGEIKDRLYAAPTNSIAIIHAVSQDKSGSHLSSIQLVTLLGPECPVPLFAIYDVAFGHGIVGGHLVQYSDVGRELGDLAVRILKGESPLSIPAGVSSSSSVLLDWRQLQKWKVPDSRIPAGARVEFRKAGLYEQNPAGVVFAVLAFLLEAVLIVFLISERRRRKQAQQVLAHRLKTETLMADLSTSFASLPDERADERIETSLERIAKFMAVDRAALWKLEPGDRFNKRYFWTDRPDTNPLELRDDSLPYLCERLRNGRDVHVARPGDLPYSVADVVSFARIGVRAVLAVPLMMGGRLVGAVTLANYTKDQDWTEWQIRAIHSFAALLAVAIERKQTNDAVRESESLNEAMLSSVPGYIVVIDRDGRVLKAGDRSLAGELPPSLKPDAPGSIYFENWNLVGTGEQEGDLARLVTSIAEGLYDKQVVEYRYSGSDGDRWLEIRIQRLFRDAGGALISHLDVTDRKRAELSASQSLQNLAHFERVASMGELAASLAHEVKQPLAAVAITTEAVRNLLRAPACDLAELDEAVVEIQEDNRRAGEILVKLRSLVQKQAPTLTLLSVNELVSEVLKFVRNYALIERVAIVRQLAPELPSVLADRVHLQQVLLNLIMNGMEAMKSVPVDERVLTLETYTSRDSSVAIEVRDRGPGITPSLLTSIFEPFFTTKQDGLGIGLSISRSILLTYRGTISAANAPAGGAVFRVVLPAAEVAPPSIAG